MSLFQAKNIKPNRLEPIARWAKNTSGSTITKGSVVSLVMSAAESNGTPIMTAITPTTQALASAKGPLMVALHDVPTDRMGRVGEWIIMTGVNTNGSTVGNAVYASDTGTWTLTPGSWPVRVGSVLKVSATAGVIIIEPNAHQGLYGQKFFFESKLAVGDLPRAHLLGRVPSVVLVNPVATDNPIVPIVITHGTHTNTQIVMTAVTGCTHVSILAF